MPLMPDAKTHRMVPAERAERAERELAELRGLVRSVLVLPVHKAGVVVPLSLRSQLQTATHRATRHPVRFEDNGAERCLTLDQASALVRRIEEAIRVHEASAPSPQSSEEQKP